MRRFAAARLSHLFRGAVSLVLLSLIAVTPSAAQDLLTMPHPEAKPDPAAPPTGDIVELAALVVPLPAPRPSVPEGYSPPAPDLAKPARFLFGGRMEPAPLEARSIGSYARGCLAGAAALPIDGETWQVMRLSRNRNWGHPDLITFLEDLAASAPDLGWNGLLVGDLAQPRGGPMLTGHASHQIGLDADIWLTPMPDRRLSREEREQMSAISMLKDAGMTVDPAIWTDAHARLIRQAASDPRVERIFVHPAIKKALCEFSGDPDANADWLRHVRPWYGHHYHFHVRMKCPEGQTACRNQDPPPAGAGCGQALSWWLSDEPYKPKPGQPAKRRETMLGDLPSACRSVLLAD